MTENQLQKPEFQKLDEMRGKDAKLFEAAFDLLFSVGYDTLTDDAVERTIKEIESAEAWSEKDGGVLVISPGYQIDILRTAAKIREVPLWTLLKYISKKVKIS